ncbi:carbohydrate ABC transporter substrate-binding protein (CUT1 family) [Salana multivorans]|uniref:Carbohydrate ABC transporter substrate-binding protein (CUT1 family) n=1 Tax=Salana multivorans TaxID=120377 RepID=A0A3N2D109_9MICO|nr:extracellular solute-binding protein [Salana multivorans]MBN8881897.1 extracellular solute-binding protein [Salana multivorans]ROR93465.1 carbohydrate ABC transporter substrate-binding protein (CUT1 family) [Salana multivorans]
MVRHKAIRAVLIGAAAALVLSGCGRADDAGTPSGDASNGGSQAAIDDSPAEGEITIWMMGEEGEKFPDFATKFTEENPDAKITVTTIPWGDVMTKFQTAVTAGTTPDAIMIGSSGMAAMVATGGLAQVPDGLVDAGSFVQGAADSVVANDATWAVPWYVETRVLYYRSDLAAEYGLDAPTTWDEALEFSKAFQEHGAEWGMQLPVGQVENPSQVILPWYSQQGGSALTADGTAYDFDNDLMVEAMEYYASFFEQGVSPLTGYGDTAAPSFVDGSNPVFISGPWMVNVLGDLAGADWVDQNVATAVIPGGKDNNNSYIGGAHLGVFKDAKNADGAWKLIRWLSQPEVQQEWWEASSDLPSVSSAWDYEPLQADERFKVLSDQLENTVAPPSVPTWDEIGGVISTESEKLIHGQTTAEEAVKAIQAKADAVGLGW